MECVSDTDRLSGKLMIRWERNMVRNRVSGWQDRRVEVEVLTGL